MTPVDDVTPEPRVARAVAETALARRPFRLGMLAGVLRGLVTVTILMGVCSLVRHEPMDLGLDRADWPVLLFIIGGITMGPVLDRRRSARAADAVEVARVLAVHGLFDERTVVAQAPDGRCFQWGAYGPRSAIAVGDVCWCTVLEKGRPARIVGQVRGTARVLEPASTPTLVDRRLL